jgi:hypothetical protein
MVDISYSPQIQPESLPGRAIPRLPEEVPQAAFGGEVGRGVENVGSAVQQHVDAVMSQARTTQLTDAHNQLQALSLGLTHDPQTGAFTKQGKDAFGISQQYLPQFDQQAQKIISSVPDPIARQHAQLAAAQVRNQLSEQLDAHELQQHKEFGINTAKASIALAQEAGASNYNHPDILATNLDHVDASLESLGQQQGWSSDMLDQAKHEAHVQFHQGVLTNMLADNKIGMANAYLDSVRSELKPQEIKLAEHAIQEGQVKATTDSVMAAYGQDTRQGAKAITDLPNSGLTQEQQFQVTQEVERQRSALLMQRRQDPRVMNQLTALQDSIAKGEPTPAALGQIDSLWHKGALSDDQRMSLRERVNGITAAQPDDQTRMNWITDHVQNRVPIDPKSQDNQKLVGQYFDSITKGVKPGTPEYTNYAADVTARVGVIPEPAVAWARAQMVGGDPASAARASDLLSRVMEASPRDVSYAIDTREKAMAEGVSLAVKSGADPMAAVEMARQNALMSESQTKALEEQWKKYAKAQPSDLTSRLGQDERFKPGWFTSVPKVPTAMQAEYDTLTQEYFRYTGGDVNQARTLASNDLKRVWGVSEVNGQRELMAYAPEQMYPGLKPDVVRNDIKTAVPGQDASKVRLAMDPQRTARTQGAEWNLVAPDKNGMLEVMRDPKGNPLIYRLPISKEDFAAANEPQRRAAQQQAADAMTRARQIQKDQQVRADMEQVDARFGIEGN